jgi:hypothetical protein
MRIVMDWLYKKATRKPLGDQASNFAGKDVENWQTTCHSIALILYIRLKHGIYIIRNEI